MPLYEYQCDACGHRFEHIHQKFSDPPIEKCTKCGSHVHKLMSSPAIQFKGSGFYITDYAKKESASAGQSDSSAEGKHDSKSEAKGDGNTESKGESRTDARGADSAGDAKGATKSADDSVSKGVSKGASKPETGASGSGTSPTSTTKSGD